MGFLPTWLHELIATSYLQSGIRGAFCDCVTDICKHAVDFFQGSKVQYFVTFHSTAMVK